MRRTGQWGSAEVRLGNPRVWKGWEGTERWGGGKHERRRNR